MDGPVVHAVCLAHLAQDRDVVEGTGESSLVRGEEPISASTGAMSRVVKWYLRVK
jgi:hypothetical protein